MSDTPSSQDWLDTQGVGSFGGAPVYGRMFGGIPKPVRKRQRKDVVVPKSLASGEVLAAIIAGQGGHPNGWTCDGVTEHAGAVVLRFRRVIFEYPELDA